MASHHKKKKPSSKKLTWVAYPPSLNKDVLLDSGFEKYKVAVPVSAKPELRIAETYEGVVEHVRGDQVIVVYEVGEDLVEQTYERRQFIDGRLPEKGDRLRVSVQVTQVQPASLEQGLPETTETSDEPADYRRKTITGPIEF